VAAPILGGLVVGAGAAAPVRANEKVRVVLIGSGGMGRGELDTFLKNPEIESPIVCDVDGVSVSSIDSRKTSSALRGVSVGVRKPGRRICGEAV